MFTVSLENPGEVATSVQYVTVDGTAGASSDYQAASGTLSFAPGETSKTLAVQVNGDTAEIGGIEPDTIAEAYVFDWVDGDDSVLAKLGTTGAIVTSNFADDHGLDVGDTIVLRSTADETATVTVLGTFRPPPFYPLIESVNVSTELFDSIYDRPRNRWTWANVPGDPSDENRAAMEEAIAGFPV